MPDESTTRDVVERTRDWIELMDRTWDLDALEGLGLTAPDIVWDLSDLGLGPFEGWAAIREFLEGWWANWEDHHHKIEEIRDLSHGVVFILILEDGCPVGSKGRVQARHGDVYEWARGKVIRITTYLDIDKARAAAERLAEERAHADA